MWTYILTDLSGAEIGEIQAATARTLSLGLNRAATASFTIRPDNPLLETLFGSDTILKVYEDSTLRFNGDVVSSEFAGGGDEPPTIRINAANPAWKLARRITGWSNGGKVYEGDKAKSARKMINEANGSKDESGGDRSNPHTGIKLLAESSYFAGSSKYIAGPYRPTLTCINDMAHTITGFDWYISPIEGESATVTNTVGSWTTPLIGLFEANNAMGSNKGVVFEHGIGAKNVKSINYVRDLSDVTNHAIHLPDDPETEATLHKFDVASQNYRGRFEATADAFGITDVGLREAWLNEVIRVKKNPRYVLSMKLDIDDGTGRVPKLGTDYWLGDLVTARGGVGGVTTLFNGQVRVYGVEIEIAESGTDTVTPILIDEEGESL